MNCKYCDGEIIKLHEKLSMKIINEKSEIGIFFKMYDISDYVLLLGISYCPFCGQKLDKEVFDYYATD